MIKKLGLYNVIAISIAIIGILLFLLTPLLYSQFNFDSDIIGLMVFMLGVALLVIGIIVKYFTNRVKK